MPISIYMIIKQFQLLENYLTAHIITFEKLYY